MTNDEIVKHLKWLLYEFNSTCSIPPKTRFAISNAIDKVIKLDKIEKETTNDK